jgi:hypothetical protein
MIQWYGFIRVSLRKLMYKMDSKMNSNGINNVYYFWSYYYFPLVCPSLRRN